MAKISHIRATETRDIYNVEGGEKQKHKTFFKNVMKWDNILEVCTRAQEQEAGKQRKMRACLIVTNDDEERTIWAQPLWV